MNRVCLSVVSHRQSDLVNKLLHDISRHTSNVDVYLTCNMPEQGLVLNRPGFRGGHLV